MEGPPEMVEGMVMKVMTSCSLRPARRARKPPMAWMPSWELPARRMTASEILETLEPPLPVDVVRVDAASLIKVLFLTKKEQNKGKGSRGGWGKHGEFKVKWGLGREDGVGK